MKSIGIQDNLYGSRGFVESLESSKQLPRKKRFLKKDIELVLILDMIGHRNQNLFVTEGSDHAVAEKLENLRGKVKLARAPFKLDDDHIPFLNAGIKTAHVIDWTNLAEWHTQADLPEIISYTKIALFGEVLMQFLNSSREENDARRIH